MRAGGASAQQQETQAGPEAGTITQRLLPTLFTAGVALSRARGPVGPARLPGPWSAAGYWPVFTLTRKSMSTYGEFS